MTIELKPVEEKEKKKEEGAILDGRTTTLEGTTGGEDVSTDVGIGQAAEAPTGGQNVSEQEAYLEANREKAMQLAGKAGDVIRGDIGKASGGMTEAERQYKEAVAAGTVGLDQELYGRASSALVDQTAPDWTQEMLDDFMAGNYQEAIAGQEATQAQGYEDWVGAQYPDQPLAGAPTPAYQGQYDEYVAGFEPQEAIAAQEAITNEEAFRRQYGAEYGGPKDIYSQDYWGQTQRDYDKAQQTRELMKTLEGRQNLVARTYGEGSGRYSRGTTALDEALLSGYDETMQELALAGDEGLGLETQMEGMAGMSEQEYLAAKEATAKTRSAYEDQFSLTGEEQEIRDKTISIKDQAKRDYEDYVKYIQDTYGVQEGIAATSYFDNPQDYLNVQAQNVMSNEDVARMKALESLTDSYGTLTPFEGQAGGYAEYVDPSADFRKEDFGAIVGQERDKRIKSEIAEQKRLQAVIDAQNQAKAAAEEADKKAQATAIGAAVGATAGAIVGSIVPGIGTAAGAIVGGAIGGLVGSVFCFDGATEFLMVDGTYKQVKDIELGDVMMEGGEVYSVSKHTLKSILFSYPTDEENSYIWVTGSHAVKEDGQWMRVAESRKASIVYEHEVKEIYSLSNENHIMISHGVVMADYAEIDNDQGLTDMQCMKVLNHPSNLLLQQ